MEIARAFGLALLFLAAIIAATAACIIGANATIGPFMPYLTGSLNGDLVMETDLLAIALIAYIAEKRKSRKSAANPTTVSQTDRQVG